MDKKALVEYFRSKGLLPFQAEFAASFLAQKNKRVWELLSPVGTGKTYISTALISHELEDGLSKRILVLAPAAILMHWQFRLSEAQSICTPSIVDRKTYLELESHVPMGENPWPLPAIILMSIDLAKRDDMAMILSSVNWDLVIIDESHLLVRDKRKKLFDLLTKSGAARRALLLSSFPAQFLGDEVSEILPNEVVDWSGKPLLTLSERKLVPVYYQRTEEERIFLNNLQSFTGRLDDWGLYGKFIETNCLRAASSGFYTTEGLLRRIQDIWRPMRNKVVHNVPWADEDLEKVASSFSLIADEVTGVEELPDTIPVQPQEFLVSYKQLESLLNQIEEITIDSRLDALVSYIRDYFEAKDSSYLCIWCSFVHSAKYLSSSLQDIGKPVYFLTGAIDPAEHVDRVEAFRETGGILIMTDAASEGLGFGYIEECINYDLPLDKNSFEQRWGRFLRVSREGEFKMVVLRDQSKSLPWEETILDALESTT